MTHDEIKNNLDELHAKATDDLSRVIENTLTKTGLRKEGNDMFIELTQPGEEGRKLYILASTVSDVIEGDGETIVRTTLGGQYVVTEKATNIIGALTARTLTIAS